MKKLFAKLGIKDLHSFKIFAVQFIKFSIVGASNTFISLGVYYLLIYLKLNYILANAIGFLLGVINSYFWNSRFVFRASNPDTKVVFLKTLVSSAVAFAIGTFTLYIMVDKIGISQTLAPIINLFITTPINFLLNKFWAYK